MPSSAQKGVRVHREQVDEIELTDQDIKALQSDKIRVVNYWEFRAREGEWMVAPVPTRLGIPLAMKIIDRSRTSSNEQIAVKMLVDG